MADAKSFSQWASCSNHPAMTRLEPAEIHRKRLLWRATHRGIKEMDLLVGGYAQAHLDAMDEANLHEFTQLLELPDQDLLSWATGVVEVPPQHDSTLLRAVLGFRPATSA
jgi:antitoxin CptB